MILNIAAHKFKRAQIETPKDIIKFFWHILSNYRKSFGKVIDFGAGDGRFAWSRRYSSYEGVEIDEIRYRNYRIPKRASIKYGCAFEYPKKNFDTCIGNPPYVSHNDIEARWRKKIMSYINSCLNICLNGQCNLYVYFICLGIIKTKPDGLIALIIPYDWMYRPSVKALRDYVNKQGWSIHVYRFKTSIFNGVETTSSITIIDKMAEKSEWRFYSVDGYLNVRRQKNMLGSKYSLLEYENRGNIWAMRGLSPGTQKIFTLSEDERRYHGLRKNDVYPCVVSLRRVPQTLRSLDESSFKRYFIDAGEKCWLIKSNKSLSENLKKYLKTITEEQRNTSTCNNREVWYAYSCHPSPRILHNSAFTKFGPKFIVNSIGAKAVGAVYGIHTSKIINLINLRNYLLNINFEKQLVPYSGKLKKVEVRQMNCVLNRYITKLTKNHS